MHKNKGQSITPCPLSDMCISLILEIPLLVIKYCYQSLFPTYPYLLIDAISLYLISSVAANVIQISLISCLDI